VKSICCRIDPCAKGASRWIGAAALALAACSQTPLNVAPIVDLSHGNGLAKPAPAAAAPATDGSYVVQKGDTLFHIAMTFHCGLRDLARWNGIDENAPIQVGQHLRVRDPALDKVPAAAVAPPPPAAALPAEAEAPAEVHALPLAGAPDVQTHALDSVPAGANALPPVGSAPATPAPQAAPAAPPGATALPPPAAVPAPAPEGAGAPAWLWPVGGRVVAAFDPVHGKGIEIAAAEDAPVVAVADGEVSYVGSPFEYGNLVILTHANGLRTVYAHNKTLLAHQGQSVQRGQTIATAGKTGATPAQLHFEVRLKGVPVNPLDYLPPR
jgi:lipoprotein NlpD